MNQYWVFFGLGIAFPMVLKYANYMLQSHPSHSFIILTIRFFADDPRTAVKTAITMCAEWVLGAVYIDRLPLPFGPLGSMPLHASLAMLFGLLSEIIAPRLVNWLVNLLPGSDQAPTPKMPESPEP